MGSESSNVVIEAVEIIRNAYVAAVSELIECYGGTTPEILETSADASLNRGSLGAVVGFADNRVKGSSILLADPKSVQTLAPSPETDLRDWLGEINNQIVGRFKNKLLSTGLLLQMSPPVTADGDGIRFTALHSDTPRWVIHWPNGIIHTLLALTIPKDLELTPVETTEVAEEGSLNLF